jgi:hypothetical protein
MLYFNREKRKTIPRKIVSSQMTMLKNGAPKPKAKRRRRRRRRILTA